jgi:hypothetical protein
MKTLSQLLTSEALPKLYKNEWTIPKINAQENLQGRTYYVEPSTLRFFNSRILSALPVSNGAFYKIIESVSLDHNNTKRGFRAVLFDIFGTVVYRPDFAECFANKEKANKGFFAWFEEFNEFEHYQRTLAEKLHKLEKEQEKLTEIYQTLKQSPATLTEEELTA